MTFHQNIRAAIAINPQSLNNAANTQQWIVEPEQIGRLLSFLLAGVIGSAGTGTCKVFGRLRSDHSTAVQLKQFDGVTGLAFTPALLADTAALDGGVLVGTIDLNQVDWTIYDAVGVQFDNDVAVASVVACIAVISDLHRTPSVQTDDLLGKHVAFAS